MNWFRCLAGEPLVQFSRPLAVEYHSRCPTYSKAAIIIMIGKVSIPFSLKTRPTLIRWIYVDELHWAGGTYSED
jgi:hypothetical protein